MHIERHADPSGEAAVAADLITAWKTLRGGCASSRLISEFSDCASDLIYLCEGKSVDEAQARPLHNSYMADSRGQALGQMGASRKNTTLDSW